MRTYQRGHQENAQAAEQTVLRGGTIWHDTFYEDFWQLKLHALGISSISMRL